MSLCASLKKPKSNAPGAMPSMRWPDASKKPCGRDAASQNQHRRLHRRLHRRYQRRTPKPSDANGSKRSARNAWNSSALCAKNAQARQPVPGRQPPHLRVFRRTTPTCRRSRCRLARSNRNHQHIASNNLNNLSNPGNDSPNSDSNPNSGLLRLSVGRLLPLRNLPKAPAEDQLRLSSKSPGLNKLRVNPKTAQQATSKPSEALLNPPALTSPNPKQSRRAHRPARCFVRALRFARRWFCVKSSTPRLGCGTRTSLRDHFFPDAFFSTHAYLSCAAVPPLFFGGVGKGSACARTRRSSRLGCFLHTGYFPHRLLPHTEGRKDPPEYIIGGDFADELAQGIEG